MVWPVRSANWTKVSSRSGAEPLMKTRMWRHASRVSVGSPSRRTYSVGTPMKTLARGSSRTTALASKRASQSILAPASSAPCEATNRPWTWKIGSAWISTSPPSAGVRQRQ